MRKQFDELQNLIKEIEKKSLFSFSFNDPGNLESVFYNRVRDEATLSNAIKGMSKILVVNLDRNDIGDQDEKQKQLFLSFLEKLECSAVSLDNNGLDKLTQNEFKKLIDIVHCSKFKSLGLSRNFFFSPNHYQGAWDDFYKKWEYFCNRLRDNSDLWILRLSENTLNQLLSSKPTYWTTFCENALCLRLLDLSQNKLNELTVDEFKTFCQIFDVKNLLALSLDDNDLGDSSEDHLKIFFNKLEKSNIRLLSLACNSIFENFSNWLPHLKNLKNSKVEVLDISHDFFNKFTEEQVKEFFEMLAANPKIQKLCLNHCSLPVDAKWTTFWEGIQKTNILHLEIKYNSFVKLTAEQEKVLVDSVKNSKLISIGLKGTHLREKVEEEISSILNSKAASFREKTEMSNTTLFGKIPEKTGNQQQMESDTSLSSDSYDDLPEKSAEENPDVTPAANKRRCQIM